MATPIKTILDDLFTAKNNWQLQLLNNWPTIIGSIQTKVQLLKIYDDSLVVGVTDSCWLQELYLLSPLLIHMINEKLDRPRIKQLRFKTMGINEKKIKKTPKKKECILKNIHLSNREKEVLASIPDDQLRAVLKEYLLRCYREK